MSRHWQQRATVAALLIPVSLSLVAARSPAAPKHGANAAAWRISTVAGGVGGPGQATRIAVQACGLAVAAGRVYIGGNTTVRAVSERTDRLTTPAGTGAFRPWVNGGIATADSTYGICGVAVDSRGDLVISTFNESRVLLVPARSGTYFGQPMTAGHIYRVAGTGKGYPLGNGGPATQAGLMRVHGVAVDSHGNLVIADTDNEEIRVVAARTGTYYGQPMTAGNIYAVAGDGTAGYVGDGGPATAAQLARPNGVAVDSHGNLVIADTRNDRIRVVAARTGSYYGRPMKAGDIYTVAGDGTAGFSGDGGPAIAAKLRNPLGVAPDAAGNLLVADSGNDRVRVVAASTGTFYGQQMTAGDIYTIAGNGHSGAPATGSPATSSVVEYPVGVAADGAGNVLITDAHSVLVQAVAAATGSFYGQAMTAGNLYTIAGDSTGPSGVGRGYFGDGSPATAAQLGFPSATVVDHAGNLVIADTGSGRVRVVAAATGTFYGQQMKAGHIYTIAGGGKLEPADGVPARSASLGPQGVALDRAGNLLITSGAEVLADAASSGTFYGQHMTADHLYVIAGTGQAGYAGDGGPATAAELRYPVGLAVDPAGNVLVADSGSGRVRVIAEQTGRLYGHSVVAGHIYKVAGGGKNGLGDGGKATSAELAFPEGVAVDASGNVVIADTYDQRIRVVAARSGTFYGQQMTRGDIYTVAGDGQMAPLGNGGRATSAGFINPAAVVVDGEGNLVIADTYHDQVRVVAAASGTYYGVKMTAGDIYSVAGTGFQGFSGDGGPGPRADLSLPSGVSLDGSGHLVISDSFNRRIRVLAG